MSRLPECEICGKTADAGTRVLFEKKYLIKFELDLCDEHLDKFRESVISTLLNKEKIVNPIIEITNYKKRS